MAKQHDGRKKPNFIRQGDVAKTKRDKKSRKIQAKRQQGNGGRQPDMSMKMVVANSSLCTSGKVSCKWCITCLLNKDKAEQLAREEQRYRSW